MAVGVRQLTPLLPHGVGDGVTGGTGVLITMVGMTTVGITGVLGGASVGRGVTVGGTVAVRDTLAVAAGVPEGIAFGVKDGTSVGVLEGGSGVLVGTA